MQLNPYIHFQGTCEEALNFYKPILNGTIEGLSYFESAPGMKVEPAYKKKVLHSIFKFGEAMFMASDSLPESNIKQGNNIALSVNVEYVKEAEIMFQKMSQGGNIAMPFQDTFWGAKFGMLTDKFGINWMFNCELKK